MNKAIFNKVRPRPRGQPLGSDSFQSTGNTPQGMACGGAGAPTLFLLQLAAFWSVWQWYAKRFAAGNPDDQWCLLAAVTAMAFLLMERKIFKKKKTTGSTGFTGKRTDVEDNPNNDKSSDSSFAFPVNPVSPVVRSEILNSAPTTALLIPTALMILYAATFHWLPPMLRAVIAMTAIGVTISQCLCGRAMRPAIGGLLVLSLPVIPLLQFYLGYPLRVVVGSITAPLLQFSGLAVIREGTSLNWNGQLISIDAPCSGIKMLWAGMFLCCAVAWLYRLNAGKTLLAGLISLAMIVVGNILRASSLFYLEAGIVQMPISQNLAHPNLAHDAVGIVTFIFTAIGIVASIRWLQRLRFAKPNQLCEPLPRSFSPVS